MVLVDVSTMTDTDLNPDKDQKKNIDPLTIIDKIIFSGGGIRGFIHIGVIRYLEEKKITHQLKIIGGTSIGALIATLLTLSFTLQEIETYCIQFDYQKYHSIDINHFVKYFGIDNFEKMMGYAINMFIKKNLKPYITFKDLYEHTNKHLIINAVCLNTHENTFFDHVSTPDMPVIIAVRASMTLPFFFGSVNYKGLTYVDGGVLCNFMINHPLFTQKPETVLGIDIGNKADFSIKEIITFEEYVTHLITSISDNMHSQVILPNAHIIKIKGLQCSVYNLSISDNDKLLLIQHGYQKINEYFKNIHSSLSSIKDSSA